MVRIDGFNGNLCFATVAVFSGFSVCTQLFLEAGHQKIFSKVRLFIPEGDALWFFLGVCNWTNKGGALTFRGDSSHFVFVPSINLLNCSSIVWMSKWSAVAWQFLYLSGFANPSDFLSLQLARCTEHVLSVYTHLQHDSNVCVKLQQFFLLKNIVLSWRSNTKNFLRSSTSAFSFSLRISQLSIDFVQSSHWKP